MTLPLPASLFLALHYLRPRRTLFSVVTLVSILGVLLGVAVLVVVISVMTGFDLVWREKILGFQAHITIAGATHFEPDEDLLQRVRNAPNVVGVAPFIEGLVFLGREGRIKEAMLRGVDAQREAEVSRVPRAILSGQFDVRRGHIVLGRGLASTLGVVPGDTVVVYSPLSYLRSDSLRLPEELIVSGVFDVGMYELDAAYAFVSLQTARDLFGLESGVHGLHVALSDPDRAPVTAATLRAELPPWLEARTWMEIHRQLFGVLQTEKNAMFFLLIFITVVAAFGISNTLITVTVQKTHEIGLLKAIGFQRAGIVGIFLWQGCIAATLGTGAGIVVGLAALRWRNDLLRALNRFTGVELLPPEFYQLAEIPARTLPSDLAWIAVSVLTICLLAGMVPAIRASRLDPARALRYE